MMRLSSVALLRTVVVRTNCYRRSFAAAIPLVEVSKQQPSSSTTTTQTWMELQKEMKERQMIKSRNMTANDKLHDIIESYRQKHFPQTLPHIFVERILEAADENEDGLISVDEMTVMLRNIYSHQPVDRFEVHFMMERDLGMEPNKDTVPMEKAKKLLLEIYH